MQPSVAAAAATLGTARPRHPVFRPREREKVAAGRMRAQGEKRINGREREKWQAEHRLARPRRMRSQGEHQMANPNGVP